MVQQYFGEFQRYPPKYFFAFCFRSCIILVRTPPLGTKGDGERGETPRGCCDGNPTLASVNSSQLQPQLAMSNLDASLQHGVGSIYEHIPATSPPYFSLHMGHAHSPTFLLNSLLSPPLPQLHWLATATGARPALLVGLLAPSLYPAPVGPRYLALPGPLRPLTSWRPSRDCCLLYTSPSPRDGLLSRMPSSA